MNQESAIEVLKKLQAGSGLGLAKYAIQQQLDPSGNWLKFNKEVSKDEHTPSKT